MNGSAAAAPAELVRVGGGSVITRMGVRQGFFARRGVRADIAAVRGSEGVRRALQTGEVDIADYGVDNALALAGATGAPLAIVFGSTSLAYQLVARPDITSLAGLRGGVLLVDSVETQSALALRKTLLAAGLQAGRDYELRAFGSTPARVEAMLKDRAYAGTLASGPVLIQAVRGGLRPLADTADHTGPMLLYAGYVMRPWAAAHEDLLTRYIAGHVETVRWMRRPGNRTEVIAALQAELQIPAAEAEASYVEGMGPAGWEPEGRLDRPKLENVARLRRELGGPTQAPIDLDRLVDERYLRRALALAGAA